MHTEYEIYFEGHLLARAWVFPNQEQKGDIRVEILIYPSLALEDIVNLHLEEPTYSDFKESTPEEEAIKRLLAEKAIEPWKCEIRKTSEMDENGRYKKYCPCGCGNVVEG